MRKTKVFWVSVFLFFFILFSLISCSPSRDVAERRNLLMPELSDIPRNKKKFNKTKYHHTNKKSAKRKKNKGRRR